MVSSIRMILFDFIIKMSGLAEVTRISGGIVAGGFSEALWLGRSAYKFHLSLNWFLCGRLFSEGHCHDAMYICLGLGLQDRH